MSLAYAATGSRLIYLSGSMQKRLVWKRGRLRTCNSGGVSFVGIGGLMMSNGAQEVGICFQERDGRRLVSFGGAASEGHRAQEECLQERPNFACPHQPAR